MLVFASILLIQYLLQLCSKASFAKERVYIGTQIEPEKKPRSPTASFFQVKKTVPEVQHPIASEVSSCLSYKLTSSSKCCDVFLIAYALHKVDYSEEKLNLLLNLADSAMSDTVHSLESTINYGDGKRSAAEEELDVKQFLPRRLSSTPVTRKKLSNLGRSNAENHRTLRKYTQELIKVSSLDSNSKSTGVRTNDSADYLGDITLVENCTVSSSEDPEDEVDETFHYPFHEIPVAVEVPDTLCWDDFTEVKYLADGSNANVYTANLSETKVVIKMIKVESLKNKIAMKEFDDEIMLLSRMNHKNIVKILGCGYSPRKFIVMEYLGAGTMTQLLAKNESSKGRKLRKPTFTYFRLLSYAKDMAEALDYLHHRCFRGAVILHRGKMSQ